MLCHLSFVIYHLAKRHPFCQDFSTFFCLPKESDRKFLGEILKIEGRDLEDFSPKFAVKPRTICKLLIISNLQKQPKNSPFCQVFLPIFPRVATHLQS